MMVIIVKLFVVLLCLEGIQAKENIKKWNRQTDVLSPSNWKGGKPPCSGAKIHFPQNMKTSAFIEFGVFSTLEMVLPDNGVIIFDDGSVVTEQNVDDSCARHAPFKYVANPGSWHDPANWVTISYQYLKPLLHSEQIPSTYDTAVFEKSNSWKVFVEDAIELQKLNVMEQELTSDQIYATFQSTEGSYSFEDRRQSSTLQLYDMYSDYEGEGGLDKDATYPITVTDAPCLQQSGCVSHGLIDEQMDKTCQYVHCEDVATLNCENPIKPIGHCCAICGMRLTFKSDLSMNFGSIVTRANEIVQASHKKWSMSLMKYDEVSEKQHYQMMVVGPFFNGTGWDKDLAWSIQNKVQKLLKTSQGVFGETLVTQISTSRTHEISGGTTFALVLLCLLLIATAVTAFWLYKNKRGPDFAMLRQNLENFRRKNTNTPITSRFRKGGQFEGEDDQIFLDVPDSPRYVSRAQDGTQAGTNFSRFGATSLGRRSIGSLVKAFTGSGAAGKEGFENPSYQNLLKKSAEGTSTESEMEQLGSGKISLNLNDDNHYDEIDDDAVSRRRTDMKDSDKSTYFSNPTFQFKED